MKSFRLPYILGICLTIALVFQNCGQIQAVGHGYADDYSFEEDDDLLFALEDPSENSKDLMISSSDLANLDTSGPYRLTFGGNTGNGYTLYIHGKAGLLTSYTGNVVKSIFERPYRIIDLGNAAADFIFTTNDGLKVIRFSYLADGPEKNTLKYRWRVAIRNPITDAQLSNADLKQDSRTYYLAIGNNNIAGLNRSDKKAYHYHNKNNVWSSSCDVTKEVLNDNGVCKLSSKQFTELNGTDLNGLFKQVWDVPSQSYGSRIAKQCDQYFQRDPPKRRCLAANCPSGKHKVWKDGQEKCVKLVHNCAQKQGTRQYLEDSQKMTDCVCNDVSATYYPNLKACLLPSRQCTYLEGGGEMGNEPGIQYLDTKTGTYSQCEHNPCPVNQVQNALGICVPR